MRVRDTIQGKESSKEGDGGRQKSSSGEYEYSETSTRASLQWPQLFDHDGK